MNVTVPPEMLKVICDALLRTGHLSNPLQQAGVIGHDVLQFQSEHPPVPTTEQCIKIGQTMPNGAECNIVAMKHVTAEWFRRAYRRGQRGKL